MNVLLGKLRRMFRNPNHFICGNVLMNMTPEEVEQYIKRRSGGELEPKEKCDLKQK